ncbi:hypothetical protein PQH03_05985 [Ralstonia insidiosa]|jgi:K+-transporting ATPase c subunit|uniref:hypothetical protein n=1 Tax=Ralstonia TaxID=48736 RepID=UPI0006649AA4|nr:hypothetical protein [Ralstonia insidiosa]KMW48057.1 hypothetical protein AC240_06750 [Ralstonia sp. MD27]MBX3770373.1 hypothetical protein [Ralstonia pickettii]NOZ16818.1 hypothetical protein [Betaproteobacteria bacterium]MBA9854530.1 hypothetical protein [Ralstonia insidiosa]MBA9868345.1 hypothetical protein [Ralstonia insidiosa]
MDAKKLVEPPNPVASEQPTIGLLQASTESLDASIRRAQEALSAVSARLARQGVTVSQPTDRFVETDVMSPAEARALAERCIAGAESDAASMARAFSALLMQVDALEADHAGRRRVLRQWMVSQLTYKMLYLHHTGQDPTVPPRALRVQKERVKAQVSALLDAGRSYADVRLTDLRFDGDSAGLAS